MKKINSKKLIKTVILSLAIIMLLSIIRFSFPGLKKYLTVEYILFLGALIITVPFLFLHRTQYIRSVILLLSLVLFGFLQFSCPRPTGSIELILFSFMKGNPVLWHLIIKITFILILTFLFARYYCGWICPKGAIQEYIFNPRLKFKIPNKVDYFLKFGKYITLILLIGMPVIFEYKLFNFLGPFKVIFNLDGTVFLIIFLGVVLLASIFIERAYCRYFCPFGGLLALISFFSFNKIKITKNICKGCNLCTKVCPTNAIEKATDKRGYVSINSLECITCKECIHACPHQAISYNVEK